MRPIHLASLDKTRPVLVLTRELVRPHLTRVTVAPITSTVRGLSTEVPVGRANGLDQASVVSCDNVVTIPTRALGRQIGRLLPEQEGDLTAALHLAFDLEGMVSALAVREFSEASRRVDNARLLAELSDHGTGPASVVDDLDADRDSR